MSNKSPRPYGVEGAMSTAPPRMRETGGVQIFPTPNSNLIAAAMAAQAINLPEETVGHNELQRVKILMEEAALQHAVIFKARATSTVSTRNRRPSPPGSRRAWQGVPRPMS